MKRSFFILTIIGALITPELTTAQNVQQEQRTPRTSRGERTQENTSQNTQAPTTTVRAQNLNKRSTQEQTNERRIRIIYRELDLTKEKNAALYYPARPLSNSALSNSAGGSQNLFTTIFKLISEDKIEAYEYLGDYEEFEEEYKIDFKQMLDRFYIYYEQDPTKKGNAAITVNENDIPAAEVRKYYVKEAWSFDQNNSAFEIKILAICPILQLSGEFSGGVFENMGEQNYPMFWLPYENLQPYIKSSYIMTSGTNNATTFTYDDFFRRRMFDGEIVKTGNPLNLSLAQYCPTPDSLKREQERIEQELTNFKNSLFTETTTHPTTKEKKPKTTPQTIRSVDRRR